MKHKAEWIVLVLAIASLLMYPKWFDFIQGTTLPDWLKFMLIK